MSYQMTDRRGLAVKPCTCGKTPLITLLHYEHAHAVVCENCNRCVARDSTEADAVKAWNFEQENDGAVLQ